MSRLSVIVWSDWPANLRHFDITLIRCSVDRLRGHWACLDVALLGFGATLTLRDQGAEQ